MNTRTLSPAFLIVALAAACASPTAPAHDDAPPPPPPGFLAARATQRAADRPYVNPGWFLLQMERVGSFDVPAIASTDIASVQVFVMWTGSAVLDTIATAPGFAFNVLNRECPEPYKTQSHGKCVRFATLAMNGAAQPAPVAIVKFTNRRAECIRVDFVPEKAGTTLGREYELGDIDTRPLGVCTYGR